MSTRITSLCDTDWYNLTQMQAVLHNYPGAMVRYEFKWRNWSDMDLNISLSDFRGRVRERIDEWCKLKFHDDELSFIASHSYMKPDFIDYLAMYRPSSRHIQPYILNDELRIRVEGPWVQTIPFETPVLSMVSELYTEHNNVVPFNWMKEGRARLKEKVGFLKNALHRDSGFGFADFGTRRRASLEHHDECVKYVLDNIPQFFAGTSNVMLAMKYGLKVIGTMAHQWLQAHQQLGVRLVDHQAAALQTWANEYRGELGIALSDVVGFVNFLKDFDRYFALLFDGCRHDSGDPHWWGEKLIKHYNHLRIDPKTKTGVFSDGLTFQIAVDLFKAFHSRINTSFGIGTYFTNDCGFLAPQIVLKMVECNGNPTAKIADSKGKNMCEDADFEKNLRAEMEAK